MARASTYTLLSLDRFCQLLGMNPLHFNQVTLEHRSVDGGWSCGETVAQYGWQAQERIGREEIAIAIAQAEAEMASVLGFDVAPRWNVQDLSQMVQPVTASAWWNHLFTLNVKLPKGYVLEGGIERRTSLVLGANVVYSSKYGSEYKETATIECVVPLGTAPGNVCIYYPGGEGIDSLEIRPINVVIDDTDCTITCRREQLVILDLQEDLMNWAEGDALDDAIFLETVDVYQRTSNPERQLDFVWQPLQPVYNFIGARVCAQCDNEGEAGCPACDYTTRSGCFSVKNRRLGVVTPVMSEWNTDTLVYNPVDGPPLYYGTPNRVLAYYRAGYYEPGLPRPWWTISPKLEKAVFMLALCNLNRDICGCKGIKDVHNYYSTDFAEASGDASGSLSYEKGYVHNPFGTKRGCIEAWKIVQQIALGRGVNVYG